MSEQNNRERFHVEQAIRCLKAEWTILAERETPDFIIKEGDHQFGLEVNEIFVGPQGVSGSEMKKGETKRQKMLEYLRAEYEKVVPIPLTVRFVGRINPETLAPVVQSLFDLDLAAEPTGFRRVIDTQLGLRVHVTKSFRPDWFSVMDRVGCVQFNSQQIIAGAIEVKSKKLPQYQIAIGPDVRLLLVANRIQTAENFASAKSAVLIFTVSSRCTCSPSQKTLLCSIRDE